MLVKSLCDDDDDELELFHRIPLLVDKLGIYFMKDSLKFLFNLPAILGYCRG